MKILVNCYACSPYQGSEPGMGWNFVRCLSRYHELHIITEYKYRDELERFFAENPEEKRCCHFYFVKRERHNLLRKIWPPSYYWYYEKWQRKVLRLAEELERKENFDVIHQLNMVGYREPGYLWMMNKPFVWGPIGGFNITPWKLLPTMGLKGCLFYLLRNIINLYQMHFTSRISTAVKSSKALICATRDDAVAVKRLWNKRSVIIPEVGFEQNGTCIEPKQRIGKMKICWSGLHIPRKSLNFLLEAVALSERRDDIELHIIGDGECSVKWKALSQKLGLDNIKWHGWIGRDEALGIMKDSHMFVITSLSDATSTVLLEALSLGLPVVALNHLGFANVITEECGIKIDLHSRNQITRDMASAIDWLYDDELYRLELSSGAIKRAKDFSWEQKAEMLNDIYKQSIE